MTPNPRTNSHKDSKGNSMTERRSGKCVSTGKVQYGSQTEAVRAMIRLGNRGLSSYRCPRCACWHLGNSRSQFKVQARIDQLLSPPISKPQQPE